MSKVRRPKADEALLDAVARGDLAAVSARITAGANVSVGTKQRYPPLFTAAASGHIEILRELIAAGADVNQLSKIEFETFASCPLVLAIQRGHFEAAQELARAGGKPDLETHPGHNAATVAARKAIECYWIASGAAGALAKIAKLPSRERHRQMRAEWMQFVRDALVRGARIGDDCLSEALKLGDEEMALLLIDNGADPDFATRWSTVLEQAIQIGSTKVALALLKAGAKTDTQERPPLLVAAARDNSVVVRALLDIGADVDTTGDVMVGENKTQLFQGTDNDVTINFDGILSDPLLARKTTALIVAVRRGNEEIVKLLVDRGADLSIADNGGKTALHWAIDLGWHQIANLLQDARSKN